jgi:uncharacterized protein
MTSFIKWAFAATAVLTAAFVSQVQAAPSFDCAKASTRVELMICDHPRIARLDSELADAYRIALRDSPWASANRRIRAEQKDWIAERNRCRNPRCLRQSYRQRIAQLRSEISGGGSSTGGGSSNGGADMVQVRGVASNDVLNVRSGPGPNYRVVGALGNGDTVRNLGCQSQGSSRWCKIEMMTDMRERGWVNARFLTVGSASQLPSMPTGEADGDTRTERVRFPSGRTGTEFTGSLTPGSSVRYIINARNRQDLYVRVDHISGPRLDFQIFNPDGSFLLDMIPTDREYRGELWQTGDHVIEVINRQGNTAEYNVIFEID